MIAMGDFPGKQERGPAVELDLGPPELGNDRCDRESLAHDHKRPDLLKLGRPDS